VTQRRWQQTVAETLDRFIDGNEAKQIVRRADYSAVPREFLGEVYLRIMRSTRCQEEFPDATETEVQKRVWALAPYHLRNAVRQVFTERSVPKEIFRRDEREDCEQVQIEELVLALPEPLQSVVRLRLASKTFTDIAAIKGVAVGTISRQFQKAVQILRASVANN